MEQRNEKLLNKPMCCPSRALSARGEVQEFGPAIRSVAGEGKALSRVFARAIEVS